MKLSIVTLGQVHAEDLTILGEQFEHLEQLVLDVPFRDSLSRHRAEFNRAVDAASADWILIVREHEKIGADLAREIFDAASAAKARGFRIRSTPYYAGAPLRLGGATGELRLFHKRHYIRFANKGEWEELAVQGTVVRLQHELRSESFASAAEHRKHLTDQAAARSFIGRALVFAAYVAAAKTLDRNTLRYLWTEAAFQTAAATG